MKSLLTSALSALLLALLSSTGLSAQLKVLPNNYAVLIQERQSQFPEWKKVADSLSHVHGEAPIILFKKLPSECLDTLKVLRPRFIGIIDAPTHIDKDYVVDINTMTRKIDDDPYRDCLWGIITGYSPITAMRLVRDACEPIVLKSAVSTISELRSGKWFDQMVCIEDQNHSSVVVKTISNDKQLNGRIPSVINPNTGNAYPNLLGTFHEAMRDLNPDVVVTASHATEFNLEMPYSLGNIKSVAGLLYTDFPQGATSLLDPDLDTNRRVYLPIGNCLIGDMAKSKNSMALAWLTSGHASCMIGYVVETWYGRAGWGGLKYFLTNAGRLNCYQSYFLNDLEIIDYNAREIPEALEVPMDPKVDAYAQEKALAKLITDRKVDKDMIGMYYDRDVLAYYGDPSWEIALRPLPSTSDYTITYSYEKSKLVITLKTHADFKAANYKGNSWKSEHVADLPMAFYFPQRVDRPQVKDPSALKKGARMIIDENALLVYADFKPNMTYRWVVRSRQ